MFKVGMSEVGTSRLDVYYGANSVKDIVLWARVKNAIESERCLINWFGDRPIGLMF